MCCASIALAISFSVLIFAFDRPTRTQLVRARAQHGGVVERVGDRREPPVDRGGARDRDLLRHDDLREPRIAAVAAAQRRAPAALQHGREARIERDQRRDAAIEIGFGVDVGGHGVRSHV